MTTASVSQKRWAWLRSVVGALMRHSPRLRLFLLFLVIGDLAVQNYIRSTALKRPLRRNQNWDPSAPLTSEDRILGAMDIKDSSTVTSSLLAHEAAIQKQFQDMLTNQQNPPNCETGRILLKVPAQNVADGFALELQTMSWQLQVAIATGRTLLVSARWKSAYAPERCGWNYNHDEEGNKHLQSSTEITSSWECLYQPISTCPPPPSVKQAPKNKGRIKSSLPHSALGLDTGIVDSSSTYFDTHYFGNRRVVKAPLWPPRSDQVNIDHIPGWERAYGRFWIRSQMVHFLFKPSAQLQREIDTRFPRQLLDGRPYIGFHIRYSDNIRDFRIDFGRDATVTRNFTHFMAHAEYIRKHQSPDICTIFLATDNKDVLAESQKPEYTRQWTFVHQEDVQRTAGDEMQYMWYGNGRSNAAPAIATDLEVLRRADFLVGSFQSNVYRLAAEANLAYHTGHYSWHMDRHRTVDIEWYEDP